MSKITVSEVLKGDPLKVEKLNSTMESIRDATLDQDNVRREGVDRRNFYATPMVKWGTASAFHTSTQAVEAGVTSVNVSASFTYNSTAPYYKDTVQFKHHSEPYGIIGPFEWETTDVALKLNLSVNYKVPGMHDGSDTRCRTRATTGRPYFVFHIGQRTGTSGTWTKIAGTERSISFNHVANSYANRVRHLGSFSISHLVDISTSKSDQYFCPFVTIWYQLNDRRIIVDGYNFYGMRITR